MLNHFKQRHNDQVVLLNNSKRDMLLDIHLSNIYFIFKSKVFFIPPPLLSLFFPSFLLFITRFRIHTHVMETCPHVRGRAVEKRKHTLSALCEVILTPRCGRNEVTCLNPGFTTGPSWDLNWTENCSSGPQTSFSASMLLLWKLLLAAKIGAGGANLIKTNDLQH